MIKLKVIYQGVLTTVRVKFRVPWKTSFSQRVQPYKSMPFDKLINPKLFYLVGLEAMLRNMNSSEKKKRLFLMTFEGQWCF